MFIATSDVHGNQKNMEPFRQVIKASLEAAKTRDCPLVIAGDLNDTKAVLRSEFVETICSMFCEYSNVEKYVLVGNHDMNNHHNHLDHSLEFMKHLPNTVVIDTAQFVQLGSDSKEWYFIPYRHTNEEIIKELEVARKAGATNLIMHQGIMGASQSEYVLDQSSISLDKLVGFDTVLLGHYHKHQTLENATYFGSPFSVSFAEANQSKGIWEISEEGTVMTSIKTNCREHIELRWIDDIPNDLPQLREDSIVKVILEGSKEFCLKYSKDDIKKMLKVNNLSIVPEIKTQAKRRIEAHKVHKPYEVINDYLEQSDTNLDKNELKKFLQEIHNENTES
jgi:DNA repair exonuclease SbcCD nuclease subunit